ncbi:hypothetical protein [Rhodococcus sp. 27YEA15]|uniref:hypothetical protein n=1 Tax=Rhodococcus sp. 27YEA15 TaxID=3156259 RepID=UPI003C7CB3B0
MDDIVDYSDSRQKTLCVHCSKPLIHSRTRDHVPTRGLLTPPYPTHLPTVPICAKCNEGFSMDERYVTALLGCVLSGSASPSEQSDPRIAKLLSKSPKLAGRIADQRILKFEGGRQTVWWNPESDRVERVILKNARGHALFESGLPLFHTPDSVWFDALPTMSDTERQRFENGDPSDPTDARLLPEVGSRGVVRAAASVDLVDGWVEVQHGIYRCMVSHFDSATVVRTVIREYLATEVIWSTD